MRQPRLWPTCTATQFWSLLPESVAGATGMSAVLAGVATAGCHNSYSAWLYRLHRLRQTLLHRRVLL